MRSHSALLVAFVLAATTSTATAGPVKPPTANGGNGGGPPAPTPVTCLNSDVSFRNNVADNCYGMVYDPANDFVGGADASGWSVNTIGVFGGSWEAFVRDNGAGATTAYYGLDWSLDAAIDAETGDWTLTIADPLPTTLPVKADLMVVLKGSTGWSSYLFSPEIFYKPIGHEGDFTMRILNNGGQIAELSHMTVYFRNGSSYECSVTDPQCPQDPPCTGPGCDDGDNPVPEPTTMALLGLGLLAASFVARRRS